MVVCNQMYFFCISYKDICLREPSSKWHATTDIENWQIHSVTPSPPGSRKSSFHGKCLTD